MQTKVVSPIIPACPPVAPEHDVVREAYELALADAEALPERDVVRATTDTGDAVVQSLAALPGLRAIVSARRAELPSFDLATFDRFERYANALTFAQARYLRARGTVRKPADLAPLVAEAQRALGIAVSDLNALAGRGLVDPAAIESLKDSDSSPAALAIALTSAADLIAELRVRVGARVIMSEEEQKHVVSLALRLRTALVESAGVPADSVNALAVRDRMFSLFRREYLALRRVADYLRFYESDSDEVFPSIFLRGKARPKSDKREGSSEPEDKREGASEPGRAPDPAADPAADDGLPQEDPFRTR